MKLSIITINRNNAAGLRKTMESVFAQAYRDFEYIVVDGASTDESVDVIKELTNERVNELTNFKWISEPDTGIYNAMNKGLMMAHGEYTLMLNSGDFLVDQNVLNHILPELDGTDIIQGNNIEEREGVLYRDCGYCKSEIDFFDVMKGYFLHQASFCKRDLFERYGYFDESYKIAGDTKFFMNCLGRHDATYKYVNIDVSNYDMNGVSAAKSGALYQQGKMEYARIMNELFSSRLVEHYEKNEKKVRLYNQLHEHKWMWSITMLLAQINALFYKKQEDIIIH